jgi:CRP-like cAMP-binding protein
LRRRDDAAAVRWDGTVERADIARLLAEDSWFRDLPESLAAEILAHGRVRILRDETIFKPGEVSDGVYAALGPGVSVAHPEPFGHGLGWAPVRLGEWFGEVDGVDGGVRNSEARAEGETLVFHLDSAALGHLLAADEAAALALIALLCRRYRAVIANLAGVRRDSVAARIAEQLFLLSDAQGFAQSRLIPISQERLAARAGLARQTLNRWLARFAAQGLVSYRYGRIEVLDRRQLRAVFAPEEDAQGLPGDDNAQVR